MFNIKLNKIKMFIKKDLNFLLFKYWRNDRSYFMKLNQYFRQIVKFKK